MVFGELFEAEVFMSLMLTSGLATAEIPFPEFPAHKRLKSNVLKTVYENLGAKNRGC